MDTEWASNGHRVSTEGGNRRNRQRTEREYGVITERIRSEAECARIFRIYWRCAICTVFVETESVPNRFEEGQLIGDGLDVVHRRRDLMPRRVAAAGFGGGGRTEKVGAKVEELVRVRVVEILCFGLRFLVVATC